MLSRTFSEYLLEFIVRVFIILPAPLLVFFVLSLVLFLTAPKGSEKRRKRKTWFIIVSVVFTAFVFVAFRIGLQQLLPRGIIESLLGF